MTRMSESHARKTPPDEAKPARSLAVSGLARAVHDVGVPVGVLVSMLVAGCVIPPSLSVENQDAGVNSPPTITAVRSDTEAYSEPGPITLIQGEGTLNVQLLDTDAVDTLYVRMFKNYTVEDPDPARSQCTAAPTQNAKRSVTCDVTGMCQMADINAPESSLVLSIVVFDREPLESGEPLYQAMPEGGLSTSRFFFLKCVEAM